MAAKDKKSVIRSLIENGKANGKLTTSEINDSLEQLDFDVEKVDKLYDTLESLNIDIVDDIDLSDLEGKDFDSEHDEDDESLLSVDGINIDDPVKVYLKEIGRVPLLTPEEAVELVGHAVGGVCPFCVKEGVKVYLDPSLRRFDIVYPACGSPNSAVKLTPEELELLSGGEWCDLCKLPEPAAE